MSGSASDSIGEENVPDSLIGKSYVLAIIVLVLTGLKVADILDRYHWMGEAIQVALAVAVLFGLFYLMGASTV